MIEVQNLRFSYAGMEVLHGVNFRINPGEICGYLGPNGAGKSTTVKLITGILRPPSGAIKICGADLSEAALEAKQKTGYVPETAAAFSLLTIREYLQLVGDLYEVPMDALQERTTKLIGSFGLGDCADRCLETLSKGQRQKTALAAALLHDPRVLVLDEPLTGLDANAARTVKELLLGLATQGRTILFCSHVLEVVERICGRVIILHQGNLVADCRTAELGALYNHRNLEAIFHQLTTDRDDGEAARGILEALKPAATKTGRK
jgi:ABC-2 type transport system ATP-binding protein